MTSKKELTRIEITLIGIAAVVFLAIIISVHRPPFFDEVYYLANVNLLHKYGLGERFLLESIGSAGPLYAVVHYLLEPFTHIKAPYFRLVNYFFLWGVIFFTGKTIDNLNTTKWTYALYILAIPLVYLVSGLALTELPAMFFFCIALYLVIEATKASILYYGSVFFSISAGLFMSLAILGRQPYLLTLAAFPFLFYKPTEIKKSIILLFIFGFFSVLLPVIVFWVWKDFVPPGDGALYSQIAQNGTSFNFQFVLNFFFYAAVCMVFLAPGIYQKQSKKNTYLLAACFVLTLILNYLFSFFLFLPMQTVLHKLFPAFMVSFGEFFFGAAVIFIGLYFIYTLWQNVQKQKYQMQPLFFAVAIIMLAISCGKVTWGFSSRYTSQAIPLLVCASSYYYKNSKWNFLRIAAGVSIGLLSVIFYYIGE